MDTIINNLPSYIPLVFILTTLLMLAFFFKILRQERSVLLVFGGIALWMAVQAYLAYSGFYREKMDALPPRFPLAFVPVLALFVGLFFSKKGKAFMDRLPLYDLTLLSIVRVPVELVLLWLFLHKTIPVEMTFEGWNFDILSGITAPLVAYFGFKKQRLGRTALLLWNIVALALLITIVGIAILSVASPLQRIGLEQPNWAIFYFPYIWLPSVVVPIVLFSHLVSIRQLLAQK